MLDGLKLALELAPGHRVLDGLDLAGRHRLYGPLAPRLRRHRLATRLRQRRNEANLRARPATPAVDDAAADA